jgi:hypothetical protein
VTTLGHDESPRDWLPRVARAADRLRDDHAVCLIRSDDGAAAGTVRVEELEVTTDELSGNRPRRFLEACELAPDVVDEALAEAFPTVTRYGAAILRVRLADDRSGVDVLPVEAPPTATQQNAQLSAVVQLTP